MNDSATNKPCSSTFWWILNRKRVSDYIIYLENVDKSLHTWIKAYILGCCCTVTEGGKTSFEQLAKAELRNKVAIIKDAASKAT